MKMLNFLLCKNSVIIPVSRRDLDAGKCPKKITVKWLCQYKSVTVCINWNIDMHTRQQFKPKKHRVIHYEISKRSTLAVDSYYPRSRLILQYDHSVEFLFIFNRVGHITYYMSKHIRDLAWFYNHSIEIPIFLTGLVI